MLHVSCERREAKRIEILEMILEHAGSDAALPG